MNQRGFWWFIAGFGVLLSAGAIWLAWTRTPLVVQPTLAPVATETMRAATPTRLPTQTPPTAAPTVTPYPTATPTSTLSSGPAKIPGVTVAFIRTRSGKPAYVRANPVPNGQILATLEFAGAAQITGDGVSVGNQIWYPVWVLPPYVREPVQGYLLGDVVDLAPAAFVVGDEIYLREQPGTPPMLYLYPSQPLRLLEATATDRRNPEQIILWREVQVFDGREWVTGWVNQDDLTTERGTNE